jgi:hypothetical protein
MQENKLDQNKINEIFTDFSNNIKKSKLISDPAQLKREMTDHVDSFVDEMIEKLNKFRKLKKNEIEKLFKDLDTNKESMNKSINSIKQNLLEFVKRNKKFFNFSQPGINNEDANNDINNTYFLLGYDILSLTNQGINQIYKNIDTMEEDLHNYLDNQEEDFTTIRTEMDKLLKDRLVDSDKKNNQKNNRVKSPKNNSSNKKNKKEEKEAKEVKEEEKEIINDLNSPSGHFVYTVGELGQEKFTPVNERIQNTISILIILKKECIKY